MGYGSFARSTKIRPLDDIDLLLLLNGSGTQAKQSPNDSSAYWLWINDNTAPLSRFPDSHGFVDSIKVLNRIRDSLSELSNYRKAEVRRNQQAVVLNLVSYDWSFDIVPAVPVPDGIGGTAHYLIPNGNGDWMRTDPRKDTSNVTRVNQALRSLFLPTLRLLKYWNYRTHKPRLGSYYFETLTLRVFETAPAIYDIPTAIAYFFDHCLAPLALPCPDPKGLGENLDRGVDAATKQRVRAAVDAAATSARTALREASQYNHAAAIAAWREVFGPEFPSYGA